MALKFYSAYPFIPDNEIYQVDVYTGNGTDATFTLKNKVASQVGQAIQFDTTVYQRYLSGFSFPTNSSFTLSSVPPLNSQGVVPGTKALDFAAFDQVVVPGQTTPANQNSQSFYLADDGQTLTNCLTTTYQPVGTNSGIAVLFQNLVTAAGANVTLMRLACANVDGSAMSYQATGTILYTAPYSALTSLAASSAALSTSLTVNSASGFYAGDYFFINPGGLTQENPQIQSIVGNTLTISGLNYAHYANETVVMNGRCFRGLATLWVGILAGNPQAYINLALVYDCICTPR